MLCICSSTAADEATHTTSIQSNQQAAKHMPPALWLLPGKAADSDKQSRQPAGRRELMHHALCNICLARIPATSAFFVAFDAADNKRTEQLAGCKDLSLTHNPTAAQSTSGRQAAMALCDRARP
jgi:hypothetical protein